MDVRVAAIDIGSNSIRLTIVDVPVTGRRVTRDEEKAYARLGHGVLETGKLSDEAMDVAVAALDRMVRLAHEREVTHVRAVATAAVREASNGTEFIERVRREVGLEIEVISGEAEGRLALLSAVDGLAIRGELAVVDIGGGSVEVVRGTESRVDSVTSMPLGAVVLADRFGGEDPLSKKAYRRLVKHVRDILTSSITDASTPIVLAGSGGTVTTLAAMVAAERDMPPAGVHGLSIAAGELRNLRSTLVASTARERGRIKGLSQSRIDLIVPGVIVLDEIVTALGAQSITVNALGMREGIIVDTVQRERGQAPRADRMRSVREFGRQCQYDVAHAEQVCRLSLELFDELRGQLGLTDGDRALLEAAALLHDVGYYISFEQHHKHSQHLISHATLPGFDSDERWIIAAVARYHSGSLPKAKHDVMEGLDADSRRQVSHLAALLRTADGLDRSHGQRVREVLVDVSKSRLTLTITGRAPLDIDAQAGERKSDLLALESGLEVVIVEAAGD
ncbi:MAG: Ppx/GppA phosphatase family protein [Coriobacteriia bacterium]